MTLIIFSFQKKCCNSFEKIYKKYIIFFGATPKISESCEWASRQRNLKILSHIYLSSVSFMLKWFPLLPPLPLLLGTNFRRFSLPDFPTVCLQQACSTYFPLFPRNTVRCIVATATVATHNELESESGAESWPEKKLLLLLLLLVLLLIKQLDSKSS